MDYLEIKNAIYEHYSSSKEPLLLSQLGQKLKNAGIWPIFGVDKTLAQILSEISPPIEVIRDSSAGSYAVVAPAEFRSIADQAIHHRQVIKYLRDLPRVVLLAFCVDGSQHSVYINSQKPYDYLVDPESNSENYIYIESEFRMPGLYIGNVASLTPVDAEELAEKIQRWSTSKQIEFLRQKTTKESESYKSSMFVPKVSAKKIVGSALDRLYDAQRPEIAQGMNIPLDIAQLLSRIP